MTVPTDPPARSSVTLDLAVMRASLLRVADVQVDAYLLELSEDEQTHEIRGREDGRMRVSVHTPPPWEACELAVVERGEGVGVEEAFALVAAVAPAELLDLPVVPVLWDAETGAAVLFDPPEVRTHARRRFYETQIRRRLAPLVRDPSHVELVPVGNPTGFHVYDLRIGGAARSEDEASAIERLARELFDDDPAFDATELREVVVPL